VRTGILRIAVLATAVVMSVLGALAHPLPGSTLTFSRVEANVEVTLTIPVPELIAAQPSLNGLGKAAKNADLPAALQNELDAYLRQYLTVTPADQSPLILQLFKAHVQDAQHEDACHYGLLVVHMSAPLQASKDLFPATLTYDAVLHEVRNHRATVWYAQPDGTPLLLGKIRFDAALGGTRPLVMSGVP
jgi:hypothetical protein